MWVWGRGALGHMRAPPGAHEGLQEVDAADPPPPLSPPGAREGLLEVDAADPDAGVDTSRHFNYFAFEGARGVQRWHHASTDFHKDLVDLSNELQPQNDYRCGG